MSTQLIPVSSAVINQETVQTVDARELHAFLEIGKDFTSWIKAQLDRARLVENQDFVKLTQKGELSKTGQIRDEYHLTIEAGKHVAMLSGTDKGFEARQYFIECERQLKQTHQMPQTFADALKLAYEQQLQIEQQQKQLTADKPKVDFYNAVTESTDAIDMGQAAKVLNVKGIGRTNLFRQLRVVGILDQNNIPKQEYCDRGYFRVIETKFSKPDGSTHISLKTIVYQKGLDYIRRVIAWNMEEGQPIAPNRWQLPGTKHVGVNFAPNY